MFRRATSSILLAVLFGAAAALADAAKPAAPAAPAKVEAKKEEAKPAAKDAKAEPAPTGPIQIAGAPVRPATKVVENCASCHESEKQAKLRKPAELFTTSKDIHVGAGLGCSSCHGGDPAAKTAEAAHKGADWVVKPASTEAAAASCGKCHAKPAENYLKGPHNLTKTAQKRPDCATCHGAHGVQKADFQDLIAEPLCSSCHNINQARRIHKAISEAEREAAELDHKLSLNKDNGVAAEQARLAEARHNLRGVAHSLDLMVITRNATNLIATTDEVKAKALPRLKARDWGQTLQIGAIVAAAIMLLIGALVAIRFIWARRHDIPVLGKMSPHGLKILAICAGVLGVIGAGVGYKGMMYMEHEPRFCLSCHTMTAAFGQWEESGHSKVECHACHIPTIMGNIKQLYDYTLHRPDKVVRHAEVEHQLCEKCHSAEKSPSKHNKITETAGHKVHSGRSKIECVQCHAESVHRFKAPKEVCGNCHKAVAAKSMGTMAEMHCLQCHSFKAVAKQTDIKKVNMKPDRVLCLDCHQKRTVKGETFPTKKAAMAWECGKCHKPHEKMAQTNADCVKCHDSITEGLHKVEAHKNDCQGCHKPHDWTSASNSCTTCHKSVNPERHHASDKKACHQCHGPWDDSWVPLKASAKAGKKK